MNHNAPVFVPRNTTKPGETSATNRNAASLPTAVHKQIVPIKSITTLEERRMFDTMTDCPSADNKVVSCLQSGQPQLVSTAPEFNLQNRQLMDARVGRHIYKEGKEEDILTQCRADASRKGDLSPMHSKTSKKSRERDRSWDGRVCVDANIRRPSMRNAKQKQVTQTFLTKPNRSRNKA